MIHLGRHGDKHHNGWKMRMSASASRGAGKGASIRDSNAEDFDRHPVSLSACIYVCLLVSPCSFQ